MLISYIKDELEKRRHIPHTSSDLRLYYFESYTRKCASIVLNNNKLVVDTWRIITITYSLADIGKDDDMRFARNFYNIQDPNLNVSMIVNKIDDWLTMYSTL